MAGFLTRYAEVKTLSQFLGYTSARPSAIYMAIASDSWLKDGSGTEITAPGYTGASTSWSASTKHQDGSNTWGYAYTSNTNVIEFAIAKRWYGFGSFGQNSAALSDAANGGHALYVFNSIPSSPYGGAGCILRFAANSVQPRLENRGNSGLVPSVLKSLLDYILGIADYTPPSTLKIGLAVQSSVDMWAETYTEFSATGYARQSISYATPAYNSTVQAVCTEGGAVSFSFAYDPLAGFVLQPVLLDGSGNMLGAFDIQIVGGNFDNYIINFAAGALRLEMLN